MLKLLWLTGIAAVTSLYTTVFELRNAAPSAELIVLDKLTESKSEENARCVAVVRIENKSYRAATLEGIDSGCNCVKLDQSSPKVIQPGQVAALRLNVTPPSYGTRRVKLGFRFGESFDPVTAFVDAVGTWKFPLLQRQTNVSPTFFRRQSALNGDTVELRFAEALDSSPHITGFRSDSEDVEFKEFLMEEHRYVGFGYVERRYQATIRVNPQTKKLEASGKLEALTSVAAEPLRLGQITAYLGD